jgi:hypothetical protein
MSSAMSYLNLIGQDKQTTDSFVDSLVNGYIEGNLDPLELYTKTKYLAKRLAEIAKSVEEEAMDKMPANKYEFGGFTLTKKEAGTRYDFSKCNHPDMDWMMKQEVELKTNKAELEKLLKSLTKPTTIVTDDGEAVVINPPIKKSTTIIELK